MPELNSEQLKILADAIGDSFNFEEMGYLLYRCVGDNKIAEIASKSDGTRVIARACLEQAGKDGVVLPFLAAALDMQKSNTALKEMVHKTMPAVEAARPTTADAVNDIVKALYAAQTLLDNPAILEAIRGSSTMLSQVGNAISILAVHKALHDQLHLLQMMRFETLENAADQVKSGEASSISQLRDFQFKLLTAQVSLAGEAGKLPDDVNRGVQQRWIEKLGKAAERLRSALDSRDEGMVMISLGIARHIMDDQPTQLNSIIFATARALPLKSLVGLLTKIASAAGPAGLDLTKGAEQVNTVGISLTANIVEHQIWQEADDFVRSLRSSLQRPPSDAFNDFARMWQPVRENFQSICFLEKGRDWVKRAQADAAFIDDILSDLERKISMEYPLGHEDIRPLTDAFDNYQGDIRLQFFKVDKALLAECTTMSNIGEPIRQILARMVQP